MSMDPQEEVARYLRTGECDELSSVWPGDCFLARAQNARFALREALVAEVQKRGGHAVEPQECRGLDVVAFAHGKPVPMVRGLFPAREQDP
jgi:hypothetical protein